VYELSTSRVAALGTRTHRGPAHHDNGRSDSASGDTASHRAPSTCSSTSPAACTCTQGRARPTSRRTHQEGQQRGRIPDASAYV
jgi:hypothetical protein